MADVPGLEGTRRVLLTVYHHWGRGGILLSLRVAH